MASSVPNETRLQDILLLETELQHLATSKKREKKTFYVLLFSAVALLALSLLNVWASTWNLTAWYPLILCMIAVGFWIACLPRFIRASQKYERFTKVLATLHLTFDSHSHKLFYWTPIAPPNGVSERTGIRGMRPPEPLYIPPSPTDVRM